MMKVPKNVLWKAADGREFMIDTEKEGITTVDGLYEHIAMLRKEHGYDEPTFSHLAPGVGRTLDEYGFNAVDVSELPPELRAAAERAIKESTSRPDPKKLN